MAASRTTSAVPSLHTAPTWAATDPMTRAVRLVRRTAPAIDALAADPAEADWDDEDGLEITV